MLLLPIFRAILMAFALLFSLLPAHSATMKFDLYDNNPFDTLPQTITVAQRSFSGGGTILFNTYIENALYHYSFEIKNASSSDLYVGTYYSCHYCRGIEYAAPQNFTNYGPKIRIGAFSSITFGVDFVNPRPDKYGRPPSFTYTVQEAPIPASGFLIVTAIGGLMFSGHALRKRKSFI